MISVGLTGVLASGKTEAARLFAKLGAKTFDADLAAKRLIRKGQPLQRAAVKVFGRQFLKSNGELDRKKLAQYVFGRPRELKKLNILIHPGVIFESLCFVRQYRHRKVLIVLDVPLLFESRMENLVDFTVVVRSTKRRIFARAAARGLSPALTRKILSAQWPMERKAKAADFVIENDGDLRKLRSEVSRVYRQIIGRHGGRL